MRFRPLHSTTLRDFYFLTVCAGIFVMMATSVLWIYATYFAPKEMSRRLAPEGVFYLRAYASARTAHGVVGIPAGERVQRVHAKAAPGMVKVTDGHYVFDVAPIDLTDDLDLAESIAANDGEAQRLLSQQAANDQLDALRARSEYDEKRAKDAATLSAQIKSASVVGAAITPLNAGARYIGSGAAVPSYTSFNDITNNISVRNAAPATTGAPLNPPPVIRYTDDPLTRLRKEAYGNQPASPW